MTTKIAAFLTESSNSISLNGFNIKSRWIKLRIIIIKIGLSTKSLHDENTAIGKNPARFLCPKINQELAHPETKIKRTE